VIYKLHFWSDCAEAFGYSLEGGCKSFIKCQSREIPVCMYKTAQKESERLSEPTPLPILCRAPNAVAIRLSFSWKHGKLPAPTTQNRTATKESSRFEYK
jgi:hypothetical protein